MKGLLVASIALGSLVPAACVVSLDPGSAAPAPPSSGSSAIRYVALGDSYTIGTGVGQNDRWPDQLVAAVGGDAPLELVANLGVNGYTSSDLIRDELPELRALDAGFVTILIGVNDVVQRVSIDRYRANVEQILGEVLAVVPRERIVVVATPDYTRTPRGVDFGNPEEQRAGIHAVNEVMRAEATERGIAFVDISVVADQAGADRTLVAGDQLHPSGAQYGRWVELIAPVVAELLASGN